MRDQKTESVPGWYPDDSGNMPYGTARLGRATPRRRRPWTKPYVQPDVLRHLDRCRTDWDREQSCADSLGGGGVWPKWPLVVLVVGAVVLLFIVGAVNGGEETQAAADRPSGRSPRP